MTPPMKYEAFVFLNTRYKHKSLFKNDYGIVNMQAARYCLLDLIGGTFIV